MTDTSPEDFKRAVLLEVAEVLEANATRNPPVNEHFRSFAEGYAAAAKYVAEWASEPPEPILVNGHRLRKVAQSDDGTLRFAADGMCWRCEGCTSEFAGVLFDRRESPCPAAATPADQEAKK